MKDDFLKSNSAKTAWKFRSSLSSSNSANVQSLFDAFYVNYLVH